MPRKYNGVERIIFIETYNFFLKYENMTDTPSNWDNCAKEASMIVNKYKNHPLITQIMIALLDQLSHKVSNNMANGFDYNTWEKIFNEIEK